MELVRRLFKKDIQPVGFHENNEALFFRDLENLKILLKQYGLSYYETKGGENKATGNMSVGDLTKLKMEAFRKELVLMIDKYPDRINELRDEITKISQEEGSTGVRDQDSLAYFAGEVRNLFPSQSDKYSEL
jgi:hypothetical protein